MKECTICKVEKKFELFQKHKKMKDSTINQCKECRNLQCKKSYEKNSTKDKRREKYLKNRENSLECTKRWHENNKELRREYRRNYLGKRRKEEIYRLRESISNLIRMTFYNSEFIKTSKSFDILGCNIQEFKSYLESRFQDWMTFDNYGQPKDENDKRWVFDHIIPISTAKTKEDIVRLNHYTNFQPLEFMENIKKSNNLI